jgi:hypothetical protein
MEAKSGKPKLGRAFWRITGLAMAVILAAGAWEVHRLRQRLPAELVQDIRAAVAARNIKDADQRFQKYIELRYGPQTNLANREKVFVDFFNVDHIRALQLIVKHSPESMRQSNINATAKWVAQFRQSLAPGELADLSAQLQAGGGNSMLAQATAQYNSQDVRYRGQTAPVISELLKTIASAQNR